MTIECPHGMRVTTEEPSPYYVSQWVRKILFACPRCRFEAEGFIPFDEDGKPSEDAV